MGIFQEYTTAATVKNEYSDDASSKGDGYEVPEKKQGDFSNIPFDSLSIGDMHNFVFYAGTFGGNIAEFDQQDTDLLMDKIRLLKSRSFDTSDKLFKWTLEMMFHFWDIYEEDDKFNRESLKNPAIWPESHIKFIELALQESFEGSKNGLQSIWWWVGYKKGGSNEAETWANNVLSEYAAVGSAGDIVSTKVIEPAKSEEAFIKEALEKADFFVKGRGLEKAYDIGIKKHDDLVLGEKKIGFVGSSLFHPLDWYFAYKTQMNTYIGITYFTEKKYLNPTDQLGSGEHISPNGRPNKNTGNWDLKMVNRTGMFEANYASDGKGTLYVDEIVAEMHKASYTLTRSRILGGDRFKPRKIQTLSSYKNSTKYFYIHTQDLTDPLGIQDRDLAGLEEFAEAAKAELKEIANAVLNRPARDGYIDTYRRTSLNEAKTNCFNKYKDLMESGDWAKKTPSASIDRKANTIDLLANDGKTKISKGYRPGKTKQRQITERKKSDLYGEPADLVIRYVDSKERNSIRANIAGQLQSYYNQGKTIEYSQDFYEKYLDDIVRRGITGETKRYTQLQWFQQFTSALGYLIAFNYVTWKHTLENIALWKAALTIPRNETKRTADIGELVKAAYEYDQQIFDGNTAAAVGDDELSDDQIEERQLYLKQCALLLNMSKLKETIIEEQVKRMERDEDFAFPYGEFILPMDVEEGNREPRSQMINRLIAPKLDDISAFLNLTPDIQAALVPKIRLFKVMSRDGQLEEVEIVFPTRMSDKASSFQVRDEKFSRGDGCGIKDFTMSFQGGNPATSRKDMNASLTLFFQDFAEFVKMRRTSDLFKNSANVETPEYRYVDLLLMPGSTGGHSSPKHPFNYNASDYRIRADVGWSIRKDTNFKNLVKQRIKPAKIKIEADREETKTISGYERLASALQKINKSYFLNRIEDNIDFREDGSVEITIEYAGYIESEFRSNRLDALLTPELLKEKTVINEEYDEIIKKGICKENKNRFEELVSTYSAIEADFIARSHRSIVNRLLTREKLHYCFIDEKDISLFAKNGYFFGPPTLYLPKEIKTIVGGDDFEITTKQVAADKNDEGAGKKEKFYDSSLEDFADWPMNKAGSLVTFFYLGDLIDVCLDCMYKVDKPREPMDDLKKTMFLLGSFDYYDINNNLKNINMSQIPISTEYFFEWMNDKVIKNKRRSYPITLFIRDLCNKMISELMQEVCVNAGKVEKSIRFNTMNLINAGFPVTAMPNFVDASEEKGQYGLNVTDSYRIGDLPFDTNIPEEKTINDAENIFVVYAVVPTDGNNHNGRGQSIADGETGIYHFQLGADRGLLKRIKFNKTDIQYLREARFFNTGFNGLAQLGAVYSISVEMFGNSLFYPGMEIFIDPRNLGGSDFDPTKQASIANFLGIGGYHMITKVEQSLGPGKYSTTIEAMFVYSGDGSSRLIGQPISERDDKLTARADEFLDFDSATADACTSITYLRQIRLKDAEFKPSTPENLAKFNPRALATKVEETGD